MTAIDLPAPDAPAEEWGRLAVSIPGWRWPISTDSAPEPDMPGFFRIGISKPLSVFRLPWRSTPYAQSRHHESQHYGKGECVPDPDHWAWWGWMLRLLGPERIAVSMWVDHITVGQSHLVMDESAVELVEAWLVDGHGPRALGRACIAAAAALGKWPGGEG